MLNQAKDNLQDFVTLSEKELLIKFNSSIEGISNTESKRRLKEYGCNEIAKAPKTSIVIESLRHSINPLVGILLIAAFISGLTGNSISATLIALMVIISIIIDYIQTHRSLVAMEHLQSKVAATASVFRGNNTEEIYVKKLVPGDIIYLSAGDLVPADAILLSAKDLHVQQAQLTGESLPVEKEANINVQSIKSVYDAKNIVFSGSSIVSGTAKAIVVKTGSFTELGKVAKSLIKRPPKTEFENGIVRFGLFISKTILFLVLFVFLISILLKRDLLESLMFAIALAVGLTPEFLPMITTVTLAAGAVNMSKKKVIVKNLASIQNFGSIDILCSDKTGTLTSGEMVLENVIDIFGKVSEKTLLFGYLNSFFQTQVKSSFTVAILKHVNVNPLDRAILRHEHPDIQSYHKIDEIPFDFERKCSSIVVDISGEHLLITKGAPESILMKCTHYEIDGISNPMNADIHDKAKNLYESLGAQGFRLLAVAYRKIVPQDSYHAIDEVNLTLSGILVFTDPPLQDAAEVIDELQKAGVSVKILTGDNELVAQTVCQQVGLKSKGTLLSEEIDNLSDHALMLRAEKCDLFTRVSPNQKLRIITVLRQHGHIVGYIGDGINDAPSLHCADVGISVSNAVDVAKESADIILLERNLKVLLIGIMEGRKSFGNIMKYLMMGTSSNFGNMFSMAGAILFLPFLPMLPMQILLNNLLYDFSQLTIPTDRVDTVFTRKPRHWDIDIIRRFMLYIGPISSVFDFLTFYVMIVVFSASEALFQTGWFIESLATQTLVIFVIRTTENPFKSRPSVPLLISVCLAVLIGVVLPFTPIASTLGFVPLPPLYFLFLVAATVSYLLLVQFIKQRLIWKWIM